MDDSIRVLIVDDQPLMRLGLRTLLELEPGMVVIGEAPDGAAAIEAYARHRPDVVLMDVRMPELDGVAATREIVTRWPEARIVILTTFDEDAYVVEGLQAGAMGYLLKDVAGDELAQAVRSVVAGSALLDESVARRVFSLVAHPLSRPGTTGSLPDEPLSDRELEILQLIAQGCSNAEIAGRLFLAEGTVKNYVSRILQKLNVRDRTQAALQGRRLGLL